MDEVGYNAVVEEEAAAVGIRRRQERGVTETKMRSSVKPLFYIVVSSSIRPPGQCGYH